MLDRGYERAGAFIDAPAPCQLTVPRLYLDPPSQRIWRVTKVSGGQKLTLEIGPLPRVIKVDPIYYVLKILKYMIEIKVNT